MRRSWCCRGLIPGRGYLEKVSEGGGLEGEGITVHRVDLARIDTFIATKRAEGYAIDTRMLLLLSPGILG